MESAFTVFTHSFAVLTRSISDPKERVHNYCTPALSMKYSVFIFGIQLMRRDILALKSYQSSMT